MSLFVIDGQEAQSVDWAIIGDSGFFNGSRVLTTMQSRGPWIVDFARHMDRLATHAQAMNLGQIPRMEKIKFENLKILLHCDVFAAYIS